MFVLDLKKKRKPFCKLNYYRGFNGSVYDITKINRPWLYSTIVAFSFISSYNSVKPFKSLKEINAVMETSAVEVKLH